MGNKRGTMVADETAVDNDAETGEAVSAMGDRSTQKQYFLN